MPGSLPAQTAPSTAAEANTAELAPGEERILQLGATKSKASGANAVSIELSLQLPANADSTLYYLRVEPADKTPSAQPVRESDVALRLGSRTIDQDLEGDYNREALLVRGNRVRNVQLLQLHADSVALRLRVRLDAIEAVELPTATDLSGATAAALDRQQPAAIFRFEHAAGNPLRRLSLLTASPVHFVLHTPDYRRLGRRLPAAEQAAPLHAAASSVGASAQSFPAGTYYLELRRGVRALPKDQAAAIKVWLRSSALASNEGSGAAGKNTDAARGGADVPRPLRSIAHVPVAAGTELVPGRLLRERLSAARPRMVHTVRVRPGQPLRVDVKGASGDLMLLVRGPYRYRADFDPQGNAAHEYVVLPFAGEYQLLVQAGLDNAEAEIDYTVIAQALPARKLSSVPDRLVRRGNTDAGLYIFEEGQSPAAAVDVRSAASADLFLTLYRQYSDGSVRVEDLDDDVAGETGHESAALDDAVQTYVLVRHSSARSSRFAYRIRLQNP